MPDIQDAVSRTLDALGRDAIREDVGLEAFERRRVAARKATDLTNYCKKLSRVRFAPKHEPASREGPGARSVRSRSAVRG
jgi:hypothetical protein